MNERDFDDFYFPLTEGKLEKAKEEEEAEMEDELEIEERGKLEMKEKRDADVEFEIALALGLELTISEVEVASANHYATPPQTGYWRRRVISIILTSILHCIASCSCFSHPNNSNTTPHL